ncbi:histidinol-phosphate aminotransferase [Myxococcus fulvus]|uniref:Histidinol-phosphate aminotransferase n=1 Tax=Myxococcus fulvus TaxID=33 RepID=A0A511TGB3_MYXFU|nr:aminotransferase class I/II-fold pyridoxal phosphate-dependent enzyme [Myxococcus fulvus]AKF86094.1 hypothetical protein MFUL124B02_21335 [Myxococcus fulvus 124B02]GEN12228.1 histidinol-phosphate aminotransferase [Myxococcus fulvus]SEU27112.1 histidinol-phosphate aminotransferase [Myxococcus fulvus]
MPPSFSHLVASLNLSQPFPGRRELERKRGRPYRLRLGANECLFGMSPAVSRVLATRGGELPYYSDPAQLELRTAIAQGRGLTHEHVVVAEGIEGLLGLFTRAYLDPGDTAVTSLGGYPSFDYYVRGCGGRLVHVPYTRAGWNDLDALVDAARRQRAKLLYLANPDNPTGTHHGPAELERLLDQLPEECLLLLDEAYVEFADPGSVLPFTRSRPHLVRLRTFSKAYGLAAARVGYALASPEQVSTLDRIRQHFAVSQLSQELALAAWRDVDFLGQVIGATREGREHYAELARRVGATVLPSSANFVSFDFGGTTRARAVARWLDEKDILVRHPSEPFGQLVRITVGPLAARELLAEVLASAPSP